MTEDRASAEALWRAAVGRVLKGAPFDTLVARSRDGLPILPLYPAAEPAPPAPWRDTGQPLGILQRLDHSAPEEAGRQALSDVQSGATGLVLTIEGHPAARGFGLPETFDAALDGVAIEAVTLRLEAPLGTWEAASASLRGLADRQRLPCEALDVDFGLDPLSDAARSGWVVQAFGLQALAAARRLREHGFTSPVMRTDGRPHHEAGASEAQELAAVLAAGVAYLRALEPLGLDAARRAISFTLAADADQILTIAKFRALRRLWARIEEACGLHPRPIRLHGETAWRMLARRDPWTNLLRDTIASAAAILGGADSLGVLPFTSPLGLPDAFARRLARNTPLVLLAESHLGRVADPAAGSGAFESLTEALCREAWRRFQALERAGGLAAELAAGTWQRDLEASRARRRAEIAAGRAPIVGVTAFGIRGQDMPAVFKPAPATSGSLSPLGLPSWREAEAAELEDHHEGEDAGP